MSKKYKYNPSAPANVLDAALVQLNHQHDNLLTKLESKGLKQYNNIASDLRVLAQQQHNNRFVWLNLPEGIDSNLLERMLYFRYQLMFYYDEVLNEFHILPFTLKSKNDDQIDFYGRYNYVQPVSFNGKSTSGKGERNRYLANVTKTVIHDIPFVENKEEAIKLAKEGAVLIFDYTSQVAQYAIPKAVTQQSFVEAETEILKFTRRSLLNSIAMKWVRFQSEADAENFNELQDAYNMQITKTDRQFVGFNANMEFQESGNTNPSDTTAFWAAFEALDNLRLKTLGISSDGSVQKKAQMLQAEMALDGISTQHPLLDAWAQRLKACAIINAVWGLGITCELNIGGDQTNTEQSDNDKDDQTMGDNPEGGTDE